MDNQLQITVSVPFNADNASIAAALRMRAGLFEGQSAKEAASRKNTDSAPAATTAKASTKKAAAAAPVEEEEDDDFKADTGSDASGFDDDDDAPMAEASFDDASGEEEEEAPPKKTTKAAAKGSNGKAKKLTLDDVNDACKAHAAAKGRPATLAILQKKFKTQSVTALKPEQYEMAIAAMAVN